MLNLEYYKIFYYVAKLNSITLASEELFISQPAVSQAIRHLENSIGGSLFFRTSKGVRLTPEGEVLYSYVARGYEYIALGESKFKELLALETGEIRIGASDMTLQFYLLNYLEEFHRLYPKVKVKVTNGPTPETLDYLHSGKIDFAVVSEPVNEYKGLKVIPVSRIKDVFIANERFCQLKDRRVDFHELAEFPIICLEGNTSSRKYVDNFLKEKGAVLSPEFELSTSELIVQFVKRGLGIGCVVWDFAEKLIAEGQLFELNFKECIPARNICIVTQDKIPVSPAGKKLLKLLMK